MPQDIEPDDVLDAIEAAVEDGATDALAGGVPLPEIARRLDVTLKSNQLRRSLATLEGDGEVVQVWGVNPDTGYSRQSYLPTGHDAVADPPNAR